ncbi:MAG: ferredoxin--NADP reductase [Betaproteobacteria bacterium]
MSATDKYTVETITELHTWTPNLFSFKTTRDQGYRFVPGQFARLGVMNGDEMVWRAYSIVSASYDEFLEFYSIVVPDGKFTSRLSQLNVGDKIYVERKSLGFLTTDRFEMGKDLWMLSTGTGLAPFISILYDFKTWETYENLILVHSVRVEDELAYQEVIRNFKQSEYFSEFSSRLHYVQAVTRESVPNTLNARITDLLENGELERTVGFAIDGDRSRVMICGNPEMVDETRELLTRRGLTVNRRGAPGHLAVENYW